MGIHAIWLLVFGHKVSYKALFCETGIPSVPFLTHIFYSARTKVAPPKVVKSVASLFARWTRPRN